MDFLWLLRCTPKLLSGAHGFSEDISHPSWRMNCDRSVFWKDHSRHPLGLPDTLCRLNSPPLLVFGADKPGVKPGQWQWWRGCDHFEFSNNGCVYQPGKDLLWWAGVSKGGFEGREMGWNWVSPLVLFCGIRGRNIAENEFFSLLQRVAWQRRFPREQRHPPYTSLLLSFAAFLTPEGFSQFKNQRENKKKEGHKAWIFNTSFQTLLSGLILLLFSLQWYFLSSFMDPKGHFTCDITETLSSQEVSIHCKHLWLYFTCYKKQHTQIIGGV